MTDFDLAAGVLHRGLGFVARWPGITLVAPSDPSQDRIVEDMLRAFGPEPAPAEVARIVNDHVERGAIRDIGYLATATGGPLAMVCGAVEVLVDGEAVLTGAGGPVERHLSANQRLTLRAAKLAKAAEAAEPYDLRRGIAPGAGISFGVPVASGSGAPASPPRPDHVPPEVAVGAAPEPNAAAVEVPFRYYLLIDDDLPPAPLAPLPIAGPAAPPAPAPPPTPEPPSAPLVNREDIPGPAPVETAGSEGAIVNGIVCSRGHFNNPAASFCLVCGISMVHVTHNLVPGHRPTLGFVVFDDGSTFGLDRNYLIGREPGEPADPATAPLTIQDNNETLSRRHAELRLVDWTVQLIDLESTNGSFIWDVAMERWSQLAPHQPVELAPGDTVALGRRTFVFESVTRH